MLLFGWSSNFVGSESGQIQSAKLLQNMVANRTQQGGGGVARMVVEVEDTEQSKSEKAKSTERNSGRK